MNVKQKKLDRMRSKLITDCIVNEANEQRRRMERISKQWENRKRLQKLESIINDTFVDDETVLGVCKCVISGWAGRNWVRSAVSAPKDLIDALNISVPMTAERRLKIREAVFKYGEEISSKEVYESLYNGFLKIFE